MSNAWVQAQALQDSGDEDDTSEPSRMCPWELFEEGLDSQQAAAESPALDTALADSLQQAVHTLATSHHFAAFHDLLSPDQAYPASDTGQQRMLLSQHNDFQYALLYTLLEL